MKYQDSLYSYSNQDVQFRLLSGINPWRPCSQRGGVLAALSQATVHHGLPAGTISIR